MPGLATITFTYDRAGRLPDAMDGAGLTSFAYDALSRLTALNRLNNAQTTWTYELDNDIASVDHLFNGGITADFSYTYDAVHNRTTRTVSRSEFTCDFILGTNTTYTTNERTQSMSSTSATRSGARRRIFSRSSCSDGFDWAMVGLLSGRPAPESASSSGRRPGSA